MANYGINPPGGRGKPVKKTKPKVRGVTPPPGFKQALPVPVTRRPKP